MKPYRPDRANPFGGRPIELRPTARNDVLDSPTAAHLAPAGRLFIITIPGRKRPLITWAISALAAWRYLTGDYPNDQVIRIDRRRYRTAEIGGGRFRLTAEHDPTDIREIRVEPADRNDLL